MQEHWKENGASRRETVVQAIKFAAFSASAGVLQLAVFTLLFELCRLPYWPSYLCALVLSVVYNFTLNRAFTFQSAANVPAAMAKVFLYYCVFTPLSTWWGDALVRLGVWEYLVLLGTMAVNLTTEFLYCRLVVYAHSMNTNARARRKAGEEAGREAKDR